MLAPVVDVTKIKPEVTALDRLPGGIYLAFAECQPEIPSLYRDVVALLRGDGKRVSILIPSDPRYATYLYDVVQRLEKQGLEPSVLHATRDVILALHETHKKRSASLGDGDATADERAGFDLIESALSLGASDIHIETREQVAHVKFRINGERVNQPDIATKKAYSICSLLYNVHADANNKETNWDAGQVKDTVIDMLTSTGRHCQVRFHSAPIHPAGNFHCVMRLLIMDGQASKALEDVGYTPVQVKEIDAMLLGSTGLVLLVGAVNAGKTTSLQSLIRRIMDRRGQHIKLVTVEDPVEYVIKGASQMGVPKGRKGLTDTASESIYNNYLRATLRQDTDVVMVGEIRSNESASTVKDLVLTGRKTLSTLHVYEAFAAFARLRELGVPSSLLTTHGFIAGVVFQKLLPQLCPHCSLTLKEGKKRRALDPELEGRLSLLIGENHVRGDGVRVRNPSGCNKCNHTGIVGRTLCAEVLVPDETFLSLMRSDNDAHAREYWLDSAQLDSGRKVGTALAHAVARMEQGQIDPNDVEVQFGSLNTYLVRVRAMARESGSGRPMRGLTLSERIGRGGGMSGPATNEGSAPPASPVDDKDSQGASGATKAGSDGGAVAAPI